MRLAAITPCSTFTGALPGSKKLRDLLPNSSRKTGFYKQAGYQFVESMSDCDDATATRTYTRFYKGDVTIDHSDLSSFTLDTAAGRRNLELVQSLFRSCVSTTRGALTCAIRSKKKELITFLLDHGADVFAFEESATEPWYDSWKIPSPAPSPLSEAIRWGDAEILDLLEEKGAWSRIVNKATTPGEFEDVLIAASVRGQITIVQNMLHSRPSNTYGKDLRDALVAAIYLNEDAIVVMLLDAGANVNDGFYKASDIDAAVEEGSDTASNIDAGLDMGFPNKFSHRGPALLEALLQKNEHLVRLILDADVDLDSINTLQRKHSSMTPLEVAVEWGNLPIINEMISMGAYKERALGVSVRKKDHECTQLLVNAGVQISSDALRKAVSNNDIEMVDYLFSVGAHPADSDALFDAAALPNGLRMIERLLTEFARRYPCGSLGYGIDTLQKAIGEGNITLIKVILDAKININFEHQRSQYNNELRSQHYKWQPNRITLLGEAIMQPHATSLAILQILLKEIGNPDIVVSTVHTASTLPYDVKETALLVAIHTKDAQKVHLLIDAGANVNWPATKGIKRTPIQKAVEIGSFEITQLLINQGALVNNEPAVRGGSTALQLAAIGGYIGIAELLLENGADANAPSARVYGRTALEGAAEHGRIDMLKLLWNAGAKVHGDEYEIALRLAKENGHMATWRYFQFLYRPSEEISMDTSVCLMR